MALERQTDFTGGLNTRIPAHKLPENMVQAAKNVDFSHGDIRPDTGIGGDGGGQNDPNNKALDRTSLLGKILRINVDSGSPYSIPNDNPYKNHGSYEEEIYAHGFRNPWRISWIWCNS